MATTIYFTNGYDEPLTEQQISLLSDYNKVYKINATIKKIEYFVNNQIDGIEYFKDSNEELNGIFNSLGTNSVDIIETNFNNNYVIKVRFAYRNGILHHSEKNLLQDSKIICEQDFAANNIPKLETTIKYIYDNMGFERGQEIFNFHYNSDGTLKCIHGVGYPFSEYNQSLDASEISIYFPNLLTDNPYYDNANFMP